jgi:hypothetical protein
MRRRARGRALVRTAPRRTPSLARQAGLPGVHSSVAPADPGRLPVHGLIAAWVPGCRARPPKGPCHCRTSPARRVGRVEANISSPDHKIVSSHSLPAMVRMTAEERRESVLRAAVPEFAVGGLAGTSTEAIAGRAGVSQPYLFRLFPARRLSSWRRWSGRSPSSRRPSARPPPGTAVPTRSRRWARPTATCSPTGSCCCTSCRPTPPARTPRFVMSRAAASGLSGGPSRTSPGRPPRGPRVQGLTARVRTR